MIGCCKVWVSTNILDNPVFVQKKHLCNSHETGMGSIYEQISRFSECLKVPSIAWTLYQIAEIFNETLYFRLCERVRVITTLRNVTI